MPKLSGNNGLLCAASCNALDFVWDKVKKDRTKKKVSIFCEARLHPGASAGKLFADFLFEAAKNGRGPGASVILGTWDINVLFALDDDFIN